MVKYLRSLIQNNTSWTVFFCAAVLFQAWFNCFTVVEESKSSAQEVFKSAETVWEEAISDSSRVAALLRQVDQRDLALFGWFCFAMIVFIAYGVIWGIGYFIWWLSSRSSEKRRDEELSLAPMWGWSSIVKMFIVIWFFSLSLSFFFIFLPTSFIERYENMLILGHTIVTDMMIAACVIVSMKRYGSVLKRLGISINAVLKQAWHGLSVYACVMPIFVLLIFLLMRMADAFGYQPAPHKIVDIFVEEAGTRQAWIIYVSIFLACAIGPIIEELFFRGFLYPVMKQQWGVKVAILGSGVAFALVHMSLFAFVPIVLLGCVLAYLYERTDSIVPSITFHIAHNSVSVMYFFLLKRLFIDGVV